MESQPITNRPMRLLTVVGTRPNIIKITRFAEVAAKYPHLQHRMVHTGQHYSPAMSDVFFDELQLPFPDYSMDVDRTTVVRQIAGILVELEKIILDYKPDVLLVVGDVNSTLAAALVANKLGVRLAHIESGLRSFDPGMPEEHNRVLTDAITDLYFVTEQSGLDNLQKEGKPQDKLFFVGNTMIDTLVKYDTAIRQSAIVQTLGLSPKEYILLTMHRPANVDTEQGLQKLVSLLQQLVQHFRIVFPIHPRTKAQLVKYGLQDQLDLEGLQLTEPCGYLDFQNLILHSALVITDSGGVQEETTYRQIPCITLRPNTERPVTITEGTNVLLDFENTDAILNQVAHIAKGEAKPGTVPALWDGKATDRIFEVLAHLA